MMPEKLEHNYEKLKNLDNEILGIICINIHIYFVN